MTASRSVSRSATRAPSRAPSRPPRPRIVAGVHLESAIARELGGSDETPVIVVGMDEVGRGALAGPVVVGAVALALPTTLTPPPMRDSKTLTDAARRRLVPEIKAWALAVGLGAASPQEIDEHGLSVALSLAGHRAWASVCCQCGAAPAGLILDGKDDWLTRGRSDSAVVGLGGPAPVVPRMVVKAEDQAATVAAASIAAKVHRDDVMLGLHEHAPHFGWAGNKGYGSAQHRAAILSEGASEYHRRSWNLGLPAPAVAAAQPVDTRPGAASAATQGTLEFEIEETP
ncbi:MAG: ribonuclease HII [Micrococcus sp.]|nr:ribonuclease HII [Micrococcus sp.]